MPTNPIALSLLLASLAIIAFGLLIVLQQPAG